MISIPINRNVFSLQGLNNKITDDASVIDGHARSVGIEDADDFGVDGILPAVIHHQAFSGSLAFIVTTSDTNGVDASPIRFFLRVHVRIAIHFRRGCLKDFRFGSFGNSQNVDCAHDIGLNGFDGIELIMHRRGRAGQVVDFVHFQIDGIDDVVTNQLKVRMAEKMGDIFFAAGKKIVQTEDIVSFF